MMLSPIKIATASVTATMFAISSAVSFASKAISATFKSVNKAMTAAFKAVGDAFKQAKDAVKGALVAPFKFIGNVFSKMNPFKLFGKKKAPKIEEAFFNRAEELMVFIQNIDTFVIDFVKNNGKVLNKIFKRTVKTVID